MITRIAVVLGALLFSAVLHAADAPPLLTPPYKWKVSAPLISPAERPEDPCVAIKDPTVVFFNDKWHIFATIRSKVRSHQIEYLSFSDWNKANEATRHVLTMNPKYFCAPQVLYFTPHKKWYMIYQAVDENRKPKLQPVFSTTETLDDPKSWTPTAFMMEKDWEGLKGWIDFSVICDETHAHLFFTSNDGNFWRSETKIADFPHGWSAPKVVLKADIFEASQTYRVKESGQYITMIEAQHGGNRYFKLYLAEKLDGEWKPLADKWESPFAGLTNLAEWAKGSENWTQNISHGELLREGVDEKMEISGKNVRFLFQGVADKDKVGKAYGAIPWKLGILELK